MQLECPQMLINGNFFGNCEWMSIFKVVLHRRNSFQFTKTLLISYWNHLRRRWWWQRRGWPTAAGLCSRDSIPKVLKFFTGRRSLFELWLWLAPAVYVGSYAIDLFLCYDCYFVALWRYIFTIGCNCQTHMDLAHYMHSSSLAPLTAPPSRWGFFKGPLLLFWWPVPCLFIWVSVEFVPFLTNYPSPY